MKRISLERKLLYREHFFALCVVGLELANAVSNWM